MSLSARPDVSTPLPAALWWAHEPPFLAHGDVVASTYAALDAVLPGGGWPLGQLIELLSPQPMGADWQLLQPALVAQQRAVMAAAQARWAGSVVLVNPLHLPFAPLWQAAGVDTGRLLCLQPPSPQAAVWALEQALRCADVVAVLAWLPHASALALRRVQLAAAQSRCLVWVFRPAQMADQASPAPLRLWLECGASADGEPVLRVRVLKRRGRPHAAVLDLPWAQEALVQALRGARHWRRQWLQPDALSQEDGSERDGALDAVAVAKA